MHSIIYHYPDPSRRAAGEGLPAVALGAALALAVPPDLQSAAFLTAADKALLRSAGAAGNAPPDTSTASSGCANASAHDATALLAAPTSALNDSKDARLAHARLAPYVAASDGPTDVPSATSSEQEPMFTGAASTFNVSSGAAASRSAVTSWSPAAGGGSRSSNGHNASTVCVRGGVAAAGGGLGGALRATLACPDVWYLGGLKFLKDVALDSMLYWTPLLLTSWARTGAAGGGSSAPDGGSASSAAGEAHGSCAGGGWHHSGHSAVWASVVPFAVAAAATLALGASSERWNERRLHIAVPLIAGGAVFALTPAAAAASRGLAVLTLTVALAAADATTGPLWSWLKAALPDAHTSAISFALVNSIGKVGGFVGPYAFGLLTKVSDSFAAAVWMVAAAMIAAGSAALCYRRSPWHRIGMAWRAVAGGYRRLTDHAADSSVRDMKAARSVELAPAAV